MAYNMSTKLRKPFELTYPLKHKVVRDCKIVTEHVGDLLVSGYAYCDPTASKMDLFERYTVDIDNIMWNGSDIKSVLEITGGIEEIDEYCLRHAVSLFESQVEMIGGAK
jgi:hypothetical protein